MISITAGLLAVVKASVGTPFPDDRGDGYGGFEGPDYVIEPWDLLVLNGTKVPGISTVKVVPKKKIELSKAAGRDGGPTYDRGHEAARVDISILVWTPSQWGLLQAVLRDIWRSPGMPLPAGDRKAVSIEHPACAAPWNINAVLIESPESPLKVPEGLRINIKALQYIAPRKADVTRKAAGTGKAKLAPELAGTRNGIPPAPSKTEASPRLPLPRERGPR